MYPIIPKVDISSCCRKTQYLRMISGLTVGTIMGYGLFELPVIVDVKKPEPKPNGDSKPIITVDKGGVVGWPNIVVGNSTNISKPEPSNVRPLEIVQSLRPSITDISFRLLLEASTVLIAGIITVLFYNGYIYLVPRYLIDLFRGADANEVLLREVDNLNNANDIDKELIKKFTNNKGPRSIVEYRNKMDELFRRPKKIESSKPAFIDLGKTPIIRPTVEDDIIIIEENKNIDNEEIIGMTLEEAIEQNIIQENIDELRRKTKEAEQESDKLKEEVNDSLNTMILSDNIVRQTANNRNPIPNILVNRINDENVIDVGNQQYTMYTEYGGEPRRIEFNINRIMAGTFINTILSVDTSFAEQMQARFNSAEYNIKIGAYLQLIKYLQGDQYPKEAYLKETKFKIAKGEDRRTALMRATLIAIIALLRKMMRNLDLKALNTNGKSIINQLLYIGRYLSNILLSIQRNSGDSETLRQRFRPPIEEFDRITNELGSIGILGNDLSEYPIIMLPCLVMYDIFREETLDLLRLFFTLLPVSINMPGYTLGNRFVLSNVLGISLGEVEKKTMAERKEMVLKYLPVNTKKPQTIEVLFKTFNPKTFMQSFFEFFYGKNPGKKDEL